MIQSHFSHSALVELCIPLKVCLIFFFLLKTFSITNNPFSLTASSEGSIPIKDGEELHVIELDQGDGWTRVRRMNEWTEGFVPTTYIEITLFV